MRMTSVYSVSLNFFLSILNLQIRSDNSFTSIVKKKIASYNFRQNIWNRIEKLSKSRQEKKSLISTFACFFDCYCQSLISGRETGR